MRGNKGENETFYYHSGERALGGKIKTCTDFVFISYSKKTSVLLTKASAPAFCNIEIMFLLAGLEL